MVRFIFALRPTSDDKFALKTIIPFTHIGITITQKFIVILLCIVQALRLIHIGFNFLFSWRILSHIISFCIITFVQHIILKKIILIILQLIYTK